MSLSTLLFAQDRAEQIQQEVFVLQEQLQESETLVVDVVLVRM